VKLISVAYFIHHIQNDGVLFSHKEELHYVICRKIDGRDHHAKISQNQKETKHTFSHMQNLDLKEKDRYIRRWLFWRARSVGEREEIRRE
jgi:hypothetical protein